MSDTGHASDSKRSNTNRGLIILIGILIILVVISFSMVLFLLLREESPETVSNEVSTGGRGTVVTEDNVDEIKEQLEKPVQDGYYTTSMSIDWHFENGVSTDAYVANSTKNTRTVYFDLFLEETGEMIYSSPYIPVGKEIKGLTLDKELSPGTYETILVYHLVDDDNNELSTLSIALTIYVN